MSLTRLVEETNQEMDDVKETVEKTISSIFPKSTVVVSSMALGGDSLYVKFALGGNQKEFRNGIIDNDTALTQFSIEGFGSGEWIVERFRGSGFSIEDESGRYHFETIKVPFRKSRAKDVKKLEAIFKKYFTTLKTEMKKYGDRVQNFDLIGKNI